MVNVLKCWCQIDLDKQCRPRRSSLIRVFPVSYSNKHFVNSSPVGKVFSFCSQNNHWIFGLGFKNVQIYEHLPYYKFSIKQYGRSCDMFLCNNTSLHVSVFFHLHQGWNNQVYIGAKFYPYFQALVEEWKPKLLKLYPVMWDYKNPSLVWWSDRKICPKDHRLAGLWSDEKQWSRGMDFSIPSSQE